jgi:DNA (cytosine-5)-methyltransferase 1
MIVDDPCQDGWTRSPLGLLVPPAPRRRRTKPVGIDFFAGAGGFSMGFHQAGFHMIAAVEMNVSAALTYTINLGRHTRYGGVRFHYDTPEREKEFAEACEVHMGLKRRKGNAASASAPRGQVGPLIRGGMTVGEGWISTMDADAQRHACEHFWLADIRNLTGAEILNAIGMDVGEVAVMIGGPPCQGFSMAGRRNVMDPRNSLVFEYARLITEIMPHTFVMENVPAIETMVTPEGIPVLDAFAVAVSDGGYGEYEALRRALADQGGRAGVRGSTRSTRKRRSGDEDIPPVEPTIKARAAVAAAQAADEQLDLFSSK